MKITRHPDTRITLLADHQIHGVFQLLHRDRGLAATGLLLEAPSGEYLALVGLEYPSDSPDVWECAGTRTQCLAWLTEAKEELSLFFVAWTPAEGLESAGTDRPRIPNWSHEVGES